MKCVGLGLDHNCRIVMDFCPLSHAQLPEVPQEAKAKAMELMEMTAHLFRAPEPGELEKLGLGPDGRPLWMTPPECGFSGI